MKKTTRGYLKPYKSYVFRDKDPVIDIMRTAVQDSGMTYVEINEHSGVSTGTLSAWFKGATRRPQFATVNAVARSIGKEFKLVSSNAASNVVTLRKRA